jgi:uncharacterized membrane protein YdbT with pleckstrin-like domain
MKQLDPRAIWLFFLGFAANSFIFFGALMILLRVWSDKPLFGGEAFPDTPYHVVDWLFIIIPVASLLSLVLCFVWAKISYRLYRYELTDAGFRKEYGVIMKRQTTIPYDRIQNIDIERGIVDRILGLSNLKVQTAGKIVVEGITSDEGRLPGLSKKGAEELRDELLRRAHESRSRGL